jgi:microcystin-dependent protein
MSEPFLGEIRMVGFSYAPQGWLFCNGQLIPISQNAALFSLLGTTFGGDGVTNFALPDLRGRSPVGANSSTGPNLSPIAQGEKSGNENVSILATQMPMHTHMATGTASFSVAGAASNPTLAPSATNSVLGASGTGPGSASIWSDTLTSPVTLTNTETLTITVGPAGNNLPVPIRNPYLGTNFIIATEGIFPSRP